MRREWALFLFLGSIVIALLEGPATLRSLREALRGPYPLRELTLDNESTSNAVEPPSFLQEASKWLERPAFASHPFLRKPLEASFAGGLSTFERSELPSLDEN